MKNLIFSILLIFLPSLVFSQDLTAKQIIEKADELTRGKSNFSEMRMEIIRPTWKRSIEMKGWSKGRDYSITLITAPANEKGQVFLKRKTEMWNWIPSISRMIKIPSSMMSQGWMGSDYTNDDILKESSIVEDYNHKLIGTENIRGEDCYILELTPKENAAVIWGKITKWISKKEFVQMQSEYFDEDGDIVKSDYSYDIKLIDNRRIPTRIEIVPADEKGKKTVIYILDSKFNINVADRYFSQQNMKRLR